MEKSLMELQTNSKRNCGGNYYIIIYNMLPRIILRIIRKGLLGKNAQGKFLNNFQLSEKTQTFLKKPNTHSYYRNC